MKMKPSRVIAFLAAVAVVAAVLALAFCRSDLARFFGKPTEVATIEPRALYPGASFDVPFEPREGLHGEADLGKIVLSRDGSTFIYVAPLDSEADRYRILDTSSGATVAKGSVLVRMPPAAELEVLELEETHVAMRYGPVAVEAELSDGTATATYRMDEPEALLEIRLDEAGRGEILWQGMTLDGYGALDPDEAAALVDLATSPLARAITMVPLDLGCVDGAGRLSDQIYAPLLQPWQMILKYEIADRDTVVREFLSQSRCGFPGNLERRPEKPRNVKVLWDADHSVPSVHLYLPFDGVGQMEGVSP
jgi:hypothetical protein